MTCTAATAPPCAALPSERSHPSLSWLSQVLRSETKVLQPLRKPAQDVVSGVLPPKHGNAQVHHLHRCSQWVHEAENNRSVGHVTVLLSPQVHHGVGKRKTVVQRFHLFGAGTDAVKNTGIQLNQQVQHSVWGRGGVRARQATDKIAHVRVRCQYVRRTRHHKHQNKSQVVQALVRRHESSDAPVDYPLAAIATRGILADVQRRPSMHHLLQNGGFPL